MSIILKGVISDDGNAVLTTNYEDDFAAKGNEWTFNDVVDLSGGEIVNFALDLSTVPEQCAVFITPIQLKSSEEEVQIRIYENTEYGGGVTVEPYNRNRRVQQSKDFEVTIGATGSVLGELLVIHSAFASSGFLGSVSSGEGGSSRPLILNQNKNYLIQIENLGGGATRMEYNANLFQI